LAKAASRDIGLYHAIPREQIDYNSSSPKLALFLQLRPVERRKAARLRGYMTMEQVCLDSWKGCDFRSTRELLIGLDA